MQYYTLEVKHLERPWTWDAARETVFGFGQSLSIKTYKATDASHEMMNQARQLGKNSNASNNIECHVTDVENVKGIEDIPPRSIDLAIPPVAVYGLACRRFCSKHQLDK